jgi:hypothetical protein
MSDIPAAADDDNFVYGVMVMGEGGMDGHVDMR